MLGWSRRALAGPGPLGSASFLTPLVLSPSLWSLRVWPLASRPSHPTHSEGFVQAFVVGNDIVDQLSVLLAPPGCGPADNDEDRQQAAFSEPIFLFFFFLCLWARNCQNPLQYPSLPCPAPLPHPRFVAGSTPVSSVRLLACRLLPLDMMKQNLYLVTKCPQLSCLSWLNNAWSHRLHGYYNSLSASAFLAATKRHDCKTQGAREEPKG